MNKDLLLYNGFSPRRRSQGDIFLDNGIGILRSYLQKNDISFDVEDRIKIGEYGEFIDDDLSAALRYNFKPFLFPSKRADKIKKILYGLNVMKYYRKFSNYQDNLMDKYIEDLSDRVKAEKYSVVGIKLWFGDAFITSQRLCELIHKKSPETLVIAGGPHVNCWYSNGVILKQSNFDLAVYSEGEYALTEIIKITRNCKTKKDKLEAIKKSNLSNLMYRDGNEVRVNPCVPLSINEKVFPVYTEEELKSKVNSHTIIDGFGCDYGKCPFCIHPFIHPRYRLRDPKIIVDEIEYMLKQGIGFFTFTASDTTLPHAAKIADEILKRNLKLEYTLLTRATKGASNRKEKLTERYVKLINSGLRIIFMGAECGNDTVLKEILNKNITARDVIETVNCIRKAEQKTGQKVNLISSYIYPLPLTKELMRNGIDMARVYEDNCELIKRTRPDSVQIVPALLYNGTDWCENPEKYGIKLDREKYEKEMPKIEISVHGTIDQKISSIYSFCGKDIGKWISSYQKMCNKVSKMGLSPGLNDEQLLIGRCLGHVSHEELDTLSKELFLDTVCSNYLGDYKWFDKVNETSHKIAYSNKL